MRKTREIELNERQKRFCNNFVSKDFFANGTESYIDAYDIDVEKKGAYDGARANSSRLLKDEDICKYINLLLDDAGLNDNFVDKQLLFLINQQADFGSKIAAIREYNKLKNRIIERAQVEITHPNLISQIVPDPKLPAIADQQKLINNE